MLMIEVPEVELFDEETQSFAKSIPAQTLILEHSLVSLSKWEEIWEKPFLTKGNKSSEETLDYIRCMTITPKKVSPESYLAIPGSVIKQVTDYIEKPMTATTFSNERGKPNREIVTAELIYFWMFSHQIPLDWEKRHLNKLMTLIKVCNIKNAPPKRMDRRTSMSKHRAINAARRREGFNNG